MLKFWVKVIKSNVNCKQEWSELDTEVISTCCHHSQNVCLLYEGDGDEDPLAEEDEDAEDDEEEDPRDAGEGQPGVALLQEVIQDLRSPVQLQK